MIQFAMQTKTGSFCRPEEWKVRVELGYDRAEGWPVRTTSMQTETDGNMPSDIYFVVVDVYTTAKVGWVVNPLHCI